MSDPEQHGSSGLTDSESSAESEFSNSRNAANLTPSSRTGYNFYTHPARTSVLGSDGALLLDPTLRREPAAGSSLDMDNSLGADMSSVWKQSGSLPSFSRAFDMFSSGDDFDISGDGIDNSFFVPTYLQGSTYVQRLEEVHRSKLLAQREAKQAKASGSDSSPINASTSLPPGSHRGISHVVLERNSSNADDDDDLTPLPSRWNRDDVWGASEIASDGISLKFTGPRSHPERDHEASAVRADHFMPPQCGIFYFEVHIISAKQDDVTIAVGFSCKSASLARPVGWEPESWAFHCDDGRCYTGQNVGRTYGTPVCVGDVIGCGVNFRDREAFFTKNGIHLGNSFHELGKHHRFYPSVSLKRPNEEVLVNFGQSPFIFNIDDLMNAERSTIQKEIEATDVDQLEPGLDETDLIQTLVLQFLQHDGYVDTARAFAEDMEIQKQALSLDPTVPVTGISIKDDEDANNRQRIRRAVLEGDIDKALKYTNAYYPQVLQDNEQVNFRLRCRKFIELVRKAALLNLRNQSSRGNGYSAQDMDLDLVGHDDHGLNEGLEADSASPAEIVELEKNMLEYGQSLQAEYASDPRKEISKALNDIWALVAYPNPLKEPQVSHLLDKNGRLAVAEELNSAILSSLGKSSRASLETLYAQTSVLLDDLRQEGGAGAFVSLTDIVAGIQ